MRRISTWYWGLKGWQKPGCISSSELTLSIKLNNPFVTKILWSQEAIRNLHFDYALKTHLPLFSMVILQWWVQGRGSEGPVPPYFLTKMRREGPNKFFLRPPPPLISGTGWLPPPLIWWSGFTTVVTLFGSFIHQTNHSISSLPPQNITLGMKITGKIYCQ